MGRNAVDDAVMSLKRDVALQWHLQSNHYPPVNLVFMDTAKEAIEHAQDQDWQHEITMPNGLVKTVGEIVTELHLDAFLEQTEEDF